jgi:hypothetical protein
VASVLRGGDGEYIYPVPVRTIVTDSERSVHGELFAELHFCCAIAGWSAELPAAFAADGDPGQNSANVVNSNSTNALLPGIGIGRIAGGGLSPWPTYGKRT